MKVKERGKERKTIGRAQNERITIALNKEMKRKHCKAKNEFE